MDSNEGRAYKYLEVYIHTLILWRNLTRKSPGLMVFTFFYKILRFICVSWLNEFLSESKTHVFSQLKY
jgi:hypothetical protein